MMPEEAHHVATLLMNELDKMKPTDEQFPAKLKAKERTWTWRR